MQQSGSTCGQAAAAAWLAQAAAALAAPMLSMGSGSQGGRCCAPAAAAWVAVVRRTRCCRQLAAGLQVQVLVLLVVASILGRAMVVAAVRLWAV